MTGDGNADLETADYAAYARTYLGSIGTEETDIVRLESRLRAEK